MSMSAQQFAVRMSLEQLSVVLVRCTMHKLYLSMVSEINSGINNESGFIIVRLFKGQAGDGQRSRCLNSQR